MYEIPKFNQLQAAAITNEIKEAKFVYELNNILKRLVTGNVGRFYRHRINSNDDLLEVITFSKIFNFLLYRIIIEKGSKVPNYVKELGESVSEAILQVFCRYAEVHIDMSYKELTKITEHWDSLYELQADATPQDLQWLAGIIGDKPMPFSEDIRLKPRTDVQNAYFSPRGFGTKGLHEMGKLLVLKKLKNTNPTYSLWKKMYERIEKEFIGYYNGSKTDPEITDKTELKDLEDQVLASINQKSGITFKYAEIM